MPIREVSRSEEGGGNERNLFEPLARPPRQGEPPPHSTWPGDTAEVTRPDQIALRLLRERVLQNASRALRQQSRLGPLRPIPFLEPTDPEAWAGLILQDLSLLASRARLVSADPLTRALFARACRQGTEETLEILCGLDPEREPMVRARIQAVAAALAARLTQKAEQA